MELTGSPRAKWILENWDEMLPKFVKVFPHEYKRVLGVARDSRGHRPPATWRRRCTSARRRCVHG